MQVFQCISRHEISINTMYKLPQEILFKISEFGQIIHCNDRLQRTYLQYIIDEVSLLDPNFPWMSELMIHYLRMTDILYNVVSITGKLSLTRNTIAVDSINGIPENIITLLHNNCMEFNVIDNEIIVCNLTQDQLINSLSLIDVRSQFNIISEPSMDTIIKTTHALSCDQYIRNHVDNRGIPRQDDYLFMIENACLPEEIGLECPSDLQVLEMIISINPEFNVGELLRWLRDRFCVRQTLRNNTFKCSDARINRWIYIAYDLITSGTMTEYIIIGCPDFDDTMYVDCVDNQLCLQVMRDHGIHSDVTEPVGESPVSDPLCVPSSGEWNGIARAFTYLKPLFMLTNNEQRGLMILAYL
jgi:hypothetical protein